MFDVKNKLFIKPVGNIFIGVATTLHRPTIYKN